jgi:hypothetical protein
VPTAHATLDVWIVKYVYTFNWNICIGKPWHGPCVFYTLLIEPSEGFLDSTHDRKGFLCYILLCKNLKELGVLWVWSKNLLNRKRGHDRQKNRYGRSQKQT